MILFNQGGLTEKEIYLFIDMFQHSLYHMQGAETVLSPVISIYL